MQNYEIYIANDHAGFELKLKILSFFKNKQKSLLDLGCNSDTSVDYPDYAKKLSEAMITGENKYGILICGTGIGMSIAANREPLIRAALCINELMAEKARAHNNANVLVLGSKLIDETTALKIVDKFFNTEFEGGRHQLRVSKLSTSNFS